MIARVPWRLERAVSSVVNAASYYQNARRNRRSPEGQLGRPSILFCVPFYGYTGGSFAVISVANLLAKKFDVAFLTKPSNVMNRYTAGTVRLVGGIHQHYDFCITEAGISAPELNRLRQDGTTLIMTMHGAPDLADGTKNHGYADQVVRDMLSTVDSVQFISHAQLPIFDDYPNLHRRLIPNFVQPVNKTKHGRAAGIVCDTRLPHKNAALAIEVSSNSRAERVEVWGDYSGQRSDNRVRWNGFTADKATIYDSFDVLVHLSRLECQSLVVLEAISAGIPCVLAPLPAYAFLRGLNGIYFVDLDQPAVITAAINAALNSPDSIKENLMRFWKEHHSARAVFLQWVEYLQEVRALKSGG